MKLSAKFSLTMGVCSRCSSTGAAESLQAGDRELGEESRIHAGDSQLAVQSGAGAAGLIDVFSAVVSEPHFVEHRRR